MTNRWTFGSTLAASVAPLREESAMKPRRTLFLTVLILGLVGPAAAFDLGGALGLDSKAGGSDAELGEMMARFTYMAATCDTGVSNADVTNRVANYGLEKFGEKPDMKKVGKAAASKTGQIALAHPSCDELALEWKRIGGK